MTYIVVALVFLATGWLGGVAAAWLLHDEFCPHERRRVKWVGR